MKNLNEIITNNLELFKRYYLSKQLQDILSCNHDVKSIEKNLKNCINIVKEVDDIDSFYEMLENFGFDEVENVEDVFKFNNN